MVSLAKIILFSPVRQDFDTLNLALGSHIGLKGVAERWYYDDNDEANSSDLLARGEGRILPRLEHGRETYDVTGETHAWTNKLVSRIAAIRNAAIQAFMKTDAEYLFIVDADVIVHPDLVNHLLALNLPIVSEVYWSKWTPNDAWMPNVWDGHPYAFVSPESLVRLREPGVFPVGGLGACTLIRREVFEKGVRYAPVAGLENIWGEDRWFCIRAAAAGFSLHADTAYPPFHVYRKEQLEEARSWFEVGCPATYFRDTQLTDEWAQSIKRKMDPPKKQTIACVLPGEVFSQAWVGAWTELVHNLLPHFSLLPMFGHCSVVYFTRQSMFDALKSVSPAPDLILWIDDDQILTVDALRLLVSDLVDHPELDGVVGWAWCEQNSYSNPAMMSCGIFDREGKSQRLKYEDMMAMPSDLVPISFSGFPAVLMRGTVLEDVGARAFMPIMNEELYPPYGMSGEDVAFFTHAREKGLQFAVDRRVKVPHLKLRCAEPVVGSSLEGAPLQLEEK